MAHSDEKRKQELPDDEGMTEVIKKKESQLNRPIRISSLARLRNGSLVFVRTKAANGLSRKVPLKESNALYREERHALTVRVVACAVVLALLFFISLGIMGAQGQYYVGSHAYAYYNPAEVLRVLFFYVKNLIGSATHLVPVDSQQWLTDNVPGYWAISERAGVLGVTLISGILLAISGMLYQNVFRNPIAGPGLLGVSGGTSFGVMILVLVYGAEAPLMLGERYALCYGTGAFILIAVLAIGRRMSGPVHSLDVVSMLLIGSIVSQFFGLITSYVTLFVMDEATYATYYTISQMLIVDTSPLSWACLGVATVASIVPVFLLRHKMSALAFDEEEVRLFGLNYKRLRAVSLICGAIMILASQIHVGGVGLVTLLVPFLSRRWFGCDFSRQLAGNVCIGTIFLILCRDIADLIPFVGDGLAIGNVVSVVALPAILLLFALQQRRMEDEL